MFPLNLDPLLRHVLFKRSSSQLSTIMSFFGSLDPSTSPWDKSASFAFTGNAPTPPTTVMFHAQFRPTADADVVLKSGNGWHFATQMLFLRASSAVFRDTLLVGTEMHPSTSDEHKVEGLPVIKLTEHCDTVQRFLALCQTSPLVEPIPGPYLPTLDSLLTMCDKYDAPHVGQWAVSRFFTMMQITQPMATIAVALIHSQYHTRPCLERAIRSLGALMTASPAEGTVPGPVYDFDGTKTARTYRTGYKMANVSDIPSAYVRRLAVEDIIEISRLQFKVLAEEKYDFKQATKDFKVHGVTKTN